MSETNDSFLNNECMKAIVDLSIKHPNDMTFGKHVREFIQTTKGNPNQMKLEFPKSTKTVNQEPLDMGDVNEY